MFDHEFTDFIEGLSPGDRQVVERALVRLREALECRPPPPWQPQPGDGELVLTEALPQGAGLGR